LGFFNICTHSNYREEVPSARRRDGLTESLPAGWFALELPQVLHQRTTRLDWPDHGPVRLLSTSASLLVLGCRVPQAAAVVAGLDDVAVMGQSIRQRGRHL
jgi:hypothetical protein